MPATLSPDSLSIDTASRARLIDAYSPGSRVVRARTLKGGLGARTQVVDLVSAAGTREKVVLRVYLPREALDSQMARGEFRTIQLAQSTGIPSARPLHLDAEGEYFGTPAMLLSYLPGRPLQKPRHVAAWTEQLARAMHAIHAVTPGEYDLSWLRSFGREEIAAELKAKHEEVQEDALAQEVLDALEAGIDRVQWLPLTLVHDDFWPGNTVWLRGKLVGVIDWVDACVGDPRLDLPQCRVDALLVNGFEVCDALRDAYLRLSSSPVPDLWYFDLFLGLRALLHYKAWLVGYRDAGLGFVTEGLARERIHAFLRRALDEAATRASSP